MASKPMKPPAVKELLREIIANGTVSYSSHALEEMGDDDLHSTDIINVLRGGVVQNPEIQNGSWRYQVTTRQITVVIAEPTNERVRIVTAWRNK